MNASNNINVILDSDSGLTLADCTKISRAIEYNLNRENYDFSLIVSSSGLGEPLVLRQYKKNIGRKVKVNLTDGEIINAKIINVEDGVIELEWKSRVEKPKGKGRETVVNKRLIEHKNIKQIVVLITF